MTVTTSESRAAPSGYDPPPPLAVSVTEEPSTWVVDVQGELDIFTFPLVKHHLDVYKDKSGNDDPQRIVYSLPDLSFMDASGLRALLTAVYGHGSEKITIRNPSSPVRRLLELVDLDSMIEQTVKL